jgi:hypothetical protein
MLNESWLTVAPTVKTTPPDGAPGLLVRAGPDSYPPPTLEDEVEADREEHHQCERERVAERLLQLRHVVEVHPVDRPDQSWGEEDRGPSRDALHLLVLRLGGLGEGLRLER